MVRPALPFESELTIQLAPWTRIPDDWASRLAASLGTTKQTIWERGPSVVAEGDRRAHVSLDSYAHDVAEANQQAEILLRRHTALAGLNDWGFTVTVTSKRRP